MMQSPLRYTGGKTRAIKVLKNFLPSNTKSIISPFIGGGSFELSCAESGIKIFGYDTFLPLVDFWFYLIHDPKLLADKIQQYFNIDKAELRTWGKKLWSEQDPLMRATMFFILNRTTYGGTTVNGGLYTDIYQRFTPSIIKRVIESKIKNLEVGFLDFRQSLLLHDELAYLDPPYVGQDRLYAYSKISNQEFPHKKLSDILRKRSNWILSYNDHPLIRELYSEFQILTPSWKYGISNESKYSKEVLIISPEIESKLPSLLVYK